MVTRLGTQDKMHFVVTQILNVRAIRGQAVLGHDESQVRVFRSDVAQKTPRGVAFAVILRRAVLADDRFRTQGDHLTTLGVNDHGPHDSMRISHAPRVRMLLLTGVAVNFVGREILSAIEGKEIMIIPIGKLFEDFASLNATEHVGKNRPNLCRIDAIKNFSHAGITGGTFDPIDPPKVGVIAFVFKR